MHRNRSWNSIVGIKGIWKMTSKITLVKLGDISAKKQWGQKAEGSIQGVLRKKTHQPELHLDQNYLLKDKRQNKDPLRSITTEKIY